MRAKKNVQRFFSRRLDASGLFPQTDIISGKEIKADREFSLQFDSNLKWKVMNISYEGQEPLTDFFDDGEPVTDFFDDGSLPLALLNINPDFLPDYHPSVIALNQALICSLHLLSCICCRKEQ